MSAALRVYSGPCCLCDVGRPANAKAYCGKPLHTGDIVMISHGTYLDTDVEAWTYADNLTVIVANQFQSFSDGAMVTINEKAPAWVMGIKDCGFNDPAWRVHLVKSHSNVIDGEHWPEYGFRFQATGAAA